MNRTCLGSRLVVVGALIGAGLLVAGCERGPARPLAPLSIAELAAPKFDGFFDRFGRHATNRNTDGTAFRRNGWMIIAADDGAGEAFQRFLPGAGAWVPVRRVDTMALEVVYHPNPDPAFGGPTMQILLLIRRDLFADEFLGELGDPLVICDLSATQADAVIRDDVPDSLVDAMVDAALRGGWTPQSGPRTTVGTILRVDPDEHIGGGTPEP